jgi:predicted metalloprotease
MGLGSILLLLAVLFLMSRSGLLSEMGTSPTQTRLPFPATPEQLPPVSTPGGPASEEALVDFVSFLLDDLQATWARLLPDYRDARLVLFRGAVDSSCGFASAASGPFYCPGDQKVYIDLGFFAELHRRFGAPGDFAQAYVLAHEVGHHVQRLTGSQEQVQRAQRLNPRRAKELSVLLELQADCFAGVWGHSTAQRGIPEQGDVEEGLRAAAAIGDDNIQKMSQGYVVPEAFTHGSSEQRVRWFRRGLESGDPNRCDTFD